MAPTPPLDPTSGTGSWFGTEEPVTDLARQIAAPWADRVGAQPEDVEAWGDPELMAAYTEEVRLVFRGLAQMLRSAVGEPKPWTGMDDIRAWRDRVDALPDRQQALMDLAEALDDAVDESFPGDD